MRYVPSPTVRSMVVYGASGLAFVGANLLLARVMSTEHYALLTLLVALATLGYHLAPAGLDAVVTRGRIDVGPSLLKRVAVATSIIGIAISGAALAAYGLSTGTAALLFVATVAGGLMLVAAARFQSEQRFTLSLALTMSPNLLLLLGALAALASDSRTATLPFAILTVGLALAAGVGWLLVLRERRPAQSSGASIPLGEALALAGVSAAGMLLIQLERLVIPHVLTVADLALFGVLGAIAGSLFRAAADGRRLQPAAAPARRDDGARASRAHRTRAALRSRDRGRRRVCDSRPDAADRALVPRGQVPPVAGLLVAAIFSGVAKIAHAFARATATAVATPRELAFVNGAGWVSVALAVGAAIVAAPWGLPASFTASARLARLGRHVVRVVVHHSARSRLEPRPKPEESRE